MQSDEVFILISGTEVAGVITDEEIAKEWASSNPYFRSIPWTINANLEALKKVARFEQERLAALKKKFL